ncbi:hypothetical protein [Undibacterium sp. TS12]|uniref:hypothetical protein n=1 Tax=Undibacterium sp. TS12 TaxID=2908202 RepID=UPI001F4C635B|nr:hypothetical protein [Undibacterium sp. TS12]MCH8620964.1 hypothetical protein [Undibacterium sp. TS12]
MKVISWNLKNVSLNKLTKANTFQPLFQTYGMGNTVLDYVTNVVMGAEQWEGVVSAFPVDLFVVIELKTGGSRKGGAVSGNCLPTLVAMRDAMNAAVVAMNHNPLEYNYQYIVPVITGRHETVGFIYNTRELTPTALTLERNTVTDAFLPGRTPLVATFDVLSKPGTTMRFSGIHDPPPSGGAAVRMRPPIDFCRQLVNTPSAAVQNTFFLGDFNCQPTDSYVNGNGVTVRPFSNLANYGTDLPNNSLSSVKKRLDNNQAGQAAYLSAPYDNNIFWITPNIVIGNGQEEVVDLIGEAKNTIYDPPEDLYPARGRAVLNAYNAVSDHLPVIMEFNVI